MRQGDSERAAADAALTLDRARLGVHFHDPGRIVGSAVAEALGGRGRVAWDIYLFYPPGSLWDGSPPPPVEWYHQLGEPEWASLSRYRTGRALTRALRQAAARFAEMGLAA